MQLFLRKTKKHLTRYWMRLKQWRQQRATSSDTIHYELDLLDRNITAAHAWLQKISLSHCEKSILAQDLPTYFLLGDSNAGKTALLSRSGLSFTHTAQLVQQNLSNLESSRHCNWWVNQTAIVIDVPSRYFDAQDSAVHLPYWQHLLHNVQLPIAGVVIAISIETCLLQNRLAWQERCVQIKQQIQAIAKQFTQPLTITLCITKLDLLAGFSDFFADLGIEEQAQAFGINFNAITTTEQVHLLNTFNAEFSKLLQRLHERTLWRLQQERNIQKRNLLQNFPLQLESLKTSLTDIFQVIAEVVHYYPHLQIHGCYFCSSLQMGKPYDNLITALRQNFDFPATPYQPNFIKNQSYFVTQFWQQVWAAAPIQKTELTFLQRYKKLFLYTSVSLLLLIAATLGIHNYRQQLRAISQATQAISTYQTLLTHTGINNTNLNDLLPKLNALQESVHALQQAHLAWLSRWFTPDQQNTLQLANSVYQRALQQQFLPAIVNDLQQRLNADTGHNPAQLYGNFKAYLMFGTSSQWQTNYVQSWLPQQWDSHIRTALQQHLLQALKTKPLVINLDADTITQTRQKLWQTPNLANLGYAILNNQSFDKTFNPWDALSNSYLKTKLQKSSLTNLPLRYSRNYFTNTYTQDLVIATSTITRGDWVLGAKPGDLAVPQFENLRAAISQAYFRDYANYWQATLDDLAKLNFVQPANLNIILAELTNKKSLLEIAKIINYHSQVLLTADLAHQQLQTFIDIQDFVTPERATQYTALINNLQQLQTYLNNIKNDDRSAFLAARQRLKNAHDPITVLYQQVNTVPFPFQQWLTAVADNSWQKVLAQTLNYLNHIWQSTILPVYKTAIAGRYPVSKNTNNDISPTEFIRFFGPNGLLDNYVKTYLTPFININATRWQTIALNNHEIPFNTAAIAQLERAAIIRTMYFHDATQLATTFDLTADPIRDDLTQAQLSLNQQLLTHNTDTVTTKHFVWSADNNEAQALVRLFDKTGKVVELKTQGVWSWFKLIDKGELQQLKDTQNYIIVFHMNGYTLRYHLTAQNLLNPFIPQVLQDFRCPERLG